MTGGPVIISGKGVRPPVKSARDCRRSKWQAPSLATFPGQDEARPGNNCTDRDTESDERPWARSGAVRAQGTKATHQSITVAETLVDAKGDSGLGSSTCEKAFVSSSSLTTPVCFHLQQ